MIRSRRLLSAVVFLAAFGLAACQDAEERAEEYFLSAQEFIEAGDIDRAKIELRNVFENDRFHEEARRTFADLELQDGNLPGAYGQLQFVIEQNPDTPDVRLTLAELALQLGDLEAARRHGEAAIALVPEEPRAVALQTAFDYQDAREAGDRAAAAVAAETARLLLLDMPDSEVARRIVVDNMLQSDNPQSAMPVIEEALRAEPDSYLYNQIKLQLLGQAQDIEAIGVQLRNMVTLFPEDEELSANLIRWYLSQNDLDGAETFLRELAGADDAEPEGHLTVVQFLTASDGPEAALAELDRLTTANEGTAKADLYRSLAAVLRFEQGERDAAIATMEEITDTEDTSEQTLRIKTMLAKLLVQTDNTVGARAEVEEVLAVDPSNTEALKMRAAWAIQDDNPDGAITDLRQALNQAPRDAEILTLLAEAHLRDGSRSLAGDRLAQAVEVTGSRAEEALRYADFLLGDGRTAAALSVLADARATAPGNVDVLGRLGQQLLRQQSWLQVQRIIDDLEEIGSPRADQIAEQLSTALLVGQGRVEESIGFLQSQITEGNADERTVLQLVQLNLQGDNGEEARRILAEALAQDPQNVTYRMMDANLRSISGDEAAAEEILRGVVADAPEAEAPVRLLYVLLRGQGREEDASAVLTDALDRQPDAATLFWIRAGELEQEGDIDGAIAIYEDLYAVDSSNTLIANNLASLITTYRDDEASLERAAVIARRLRDTDVPAFQDTYGWIAYRLGNYEEAAEYLGAAAAGLPDDPLTQYHYGMALAALERNAEARDVLTRALEIAGDSPLPQFDRARETLAALPAEDGTTETDQ